MTGAIFYGTVMDKLMSRRFHGRPGENISILNYSTAVHCTQRKSLQNTWHFHNSMRPLVQ
ncbi:BgTH12-01589 [Blumeria graminis f. sp. triticale]|uniref:Bgt-5429 n=3 Tax=Blumeria graminis TaxID=34373 RepID=A0A061HE13_BLUGR|nr:hypothetical protein BGT96224_5429 [Blumeria graminis f. sp. tritici 96224]CAD6501337.1 BgTH12-01589 [Blumeria graminis f. sp. triticale]VDB83824.1 Bgt-5429 [Blumeria graminis f. sp. tritici]